MDSKDLTTDLNAMELLQKEFPLLFSLLWALKTNKYTNVLIPIINDLILKSNAPFTAPTSDNASSSSSGSSTELSYFPSLPVIRERGCYTADRVSREKLCTKLSRGHPTLLPGLFTVYCEHGK